MAREKKWFAPFEQPGRTGQIAVQRAGVAGCPSLSTDPCSCRQGLNYHLLEPL